MHVRLSLLLVEVPSIIGIVMISLVSIWLSMAVLVLILLSIVVAAVSLKVGSLALMISIFVGLVVEV